MVTSDVSLKVLIKLFMIEGTTSRSACGKTILRWVCQYERPSAAAASCCPLGIACRPPRTTSARYAAANSVMPTSTRTRTLILTPGGMNSGNMNDAMNSTEISGTPRISST